MYCKKCGTKQREGQKFCPKCGEPFLNINGQVYQGDLSKSIKKEKEDSSNADDQPLTNKESMIPRGEALSSVHVSEENESISLEENKVESEEVSPDFLSNTSKNKESVIYRWITGIAVVVIGFIMYSINSSNSSDSTFYNQREEVREDNSKEMEVLNKMSKIYNDINSILPRVEALYNAHRQHMARGYQYATSPAWGKWQDYQAEINRLWDEYISLARQLKDNRDIIEEAREKQRIMDNSIDEMFGPQY